MIKCFKRKIIKWLLKGNTSVIIDLMNKEYQVSEERSYIEDIPPLELFKLNKHIETLINSKLMNLSKTELDTIMFKRDFIENIKSIDK